MLLKINGGKLLSGEVNLQGSKNGALALLAGAILTRQKITLFNIPHIEDVDNFLKIAKELNVSSLWENSNLVIDASNLSSANITKELINSLRASIYFLPILSSLKTPFTFYAPGGCNLGFRPINFHLDLIKSCGGNYNEDECSINISVKDLHPFTYSFPQKSVGGTINALLFASFIDGVSTIENCAEEVEIKQLVEFLRLAGVDITELKGVYIVKGNSNFNEIISYKNQFDRIAASSYIAIGLTSASSLKINDVPFDDISDFLHTLDYAELNYEIKGGKSLLTYKQENKSKLKLTCQPWPGLSSDNLPIIVSLFLEGQNLVLFKDEVYPLRTRYLKELEKFGLVYSIFDDQVLLRGSRNLHPADVICTDLRGGMSALIAALMIKGTSTISNAEILLRGYENLFEILKNIGADITVDENK